VSAHAVNSSGAVDAVARHLDVLLLVLALPIVVLAGLPLVGYLAGAAVWVVQRFLGDAIERRARAAADIRVQMGVVMASIMVRIWLVAVVILAVGLSVERADGAIAAITVLAAFTVYFLSSLILWPARRSSAR
jgi:hypothetical protein